MVPGFPLIHSIFKNRMNFPLLSGLKLQPQRFLDVVQVLSPLDLRLCEKKGVKDGRKKYRNLL